MEETLTDRVRAVILGGDFVPNQRLIEADVCEQFGASRAAVRETFKELASEGLVEIMRNKGARVRVISKAEAVEITEVRMVLEGLAAYKAAERVTPEQAAELRQIVTDMRAAVEVNDLDRYSELNVALHAKIREVAGHRTAAAIIERLGAQVVRHKFRLARQPGRAAVSLPQHELVVAAIVARDPEAAQTSMQQHLRSVVKALESSAD
ncbi:putative HTH-type transcriptional regulator YdfH [Nonomuraea coxensis DSM 45129]|uniref:HTH-type transcriptional regulator YdfH n=1 Tax=Nonomuraea coxensis DSM 45129 TaxID=1122611 RepID=A0ABX8TXH4_9ACTN|nr:GntR family transcriptional regulator [Nonomuraea coxensis]QYC39941.1 putative HTH-type transcriptional regulator YdfH [Nonomuraea coxensis DSM 45129]